MVKRSLSSAFLIVAIAAALFVSTSGSSVRAEEEGQALGMIKPRDVNSPVTAQSAAAAASDVASKLRAANAGLDSLASGLKAQAAAAINGPTTATAPRFLDYKGFWYAVGKSEDGLTTLVERLELPGDQYEEKRRSEVEGVWVPRYTAYLNGDYTAGLPTIPPGMAQAMVQVDPDTSNRMRNESAFRDEVIRRMAEWTVFYDQLNLWCTFVEDQVIHNRLPSEDLPSYDPSVVDSELPALYEKLKTYAGKISDEEMQVYQSVMQQVQVTSRQQEDYENWLNDREQDMLKFADSWRHNYDGTRVTIGDTIYMVRSPKDKKPKLDAQGREIQEYLPDNAVVVDVPKEKVVTPFDLINKDGSLKKPPER